ncbi:hypothetical protein VSAK1_00602 [Vibrio mediterranei AK1]|uniref:hypothetical protein n=1 Tax=Vibrio mediterranei TaxID=689 RepID=UPI000154172D|nr:hypothetical protein [Vibrio mediterranei]EDL53586.1 hypothetical protein VSAK1_00602 [Vibrio mediterranei AK1]
MNVIVTPIALTRAIKKHASAHIKSHYKDEIDKYDVAMGKLFQKMGLLGSRSQFEEKPELAKLFELHAKELLKPENQAVIRENIRRNVYSADTIVDELVDSFVEVMQQLNVANYSEEALHFESMRKHLLKRLLGSEFSPQQRDYDGTAEDSSTFDVSGLLERVNNSVVLTEYYRSLDARTTDDVDIDLIFTLENRQRSITPAKIQINRSDLYLNNKLSINALLEINQKTMRVDIDYSDVEIESKALFEELSFVASALKSKSKFREVKGLVSLANNGWISHFLCGKFDVSYSDGDFSLGVITNVEQLPLDPSVLSSANFVVLSGIEDLLDWDFSSLRTFSHNIQSMVESDKLVGVKITNQIDKRLIILLIGMGVREFYVNESSGARIKSVIRYLSYAEIEAITLEYLSANNEADARQTFRSNLFLGSIVSE